MTSLPINITVDIDEDAWKQVITDAYKQDPRFQPVEFGFSVEHAEYQEFGTGPARGRSQYKIGKAGIDAIDRWARRKVGITDERERRKFVFAVVHKLETYGMQPRPFFRPALSLLMANMQEYLDKGMSFYDMANTVGDLSMRLIDDYGMNYDNGIQQSWFIRRMGKEVRVDSIKETLDWAMERAYGDSR